jgi:thioredoxin-related protein
MNKVKIKIRLFIFLTFFSIICRAQNIINAPQNIDGLVKWLDFKEAQELNKRQPKPFLVDIYTDWCGWCKHMIRTTYSDPGLASYINNYFYPVKFNAETKDTIFYNGEKYYNESSAPKSPHQLAKKFLGNSLSYPSTIFVNNNFQFNLLTQGYLDVKKIEPLLIYTVENIFRTTAYEDFNEKFSLTFYDSLKRNKPESVKWYSWNEALEIQKKNPKKILAIVTTQWCTGCKVMNKTTFSDPLISDFMNKNFYLVEINAETPDSLSYQGKKYYASGDPSFPFHTLLPVLTRNNFVLPSTVFIDEKGNALESVPFYLHPKSIDPILKYFGENYYLNMKWDQFVNDLKSGKLKSPIKGK